MASDFIKIIAFKILALRALASKMSEHPSNWRSSQLLPLKLPNNSLQTNKLRLALAKIHQHYIKIALKSSHRQFPRSPKLATPQNIVYD